MGIMTFLRERAGFVLIGLIVISIIAFLVSDASRMGGSLFRESNTDIAVVNGEKISTDEYNQKLQAQTEQAKQQYGQIGIPTQMMGFLGEQTWTQMISQHLLDRQVSKAQLNIGNSEAYDLVAGRNPDPRVRQTFTDRKTGVFDPATVITFLKNLKRDTATESKWHAFENELRKSRAEQKYLALVQGGIYITGLEAKLAYNTPAERRNIQYVTVDYSRIPDSKVNLTDDQLNTYYTNNLFKYQSHENSRSLDYVIFEARPSAEDSAQEKKEVNRMAAEFRTAKSDSLFVVLNSETKTPVTFYKRKHLPPGVDSTIVNQTPGFVSDPVLLNGTFRAAKLVSVKQMPDSVWSRHILLVPGKTEPLADVLKRADSLKSQIQKGANFASLAQTLSQDKGSSVKGGDLGYVAMGQGLVKPFEDAIFNGKKGELKIVQTQFGVHLIQIVDQKNISPSFEIAQIDRPFGPSPKTTQATYSQAIQFLGSLPSTGQAGLAKLARAKNLNVRTAAEVKAGDQSLPGAENARKVVQWAYTKKKGDRSEVLDLGTSFVIAEVTGIRVKGPTPLADIRRQVEADAEKAKKGELLVAQIVQAHGQGLESLANTYASAVATADSLDFANPAVGKLEDPALIGAVFGASSGKPSKPVAGDKAVYAFQVTGMVNQTSKADSKTVREKIRLNIKSQAVTAALDALRDKAEITDNRGRLL